jgi:hypothetical protein
MSTRSSLIPLVEVNGFGRGFLLFSSLGGVGISSPHGMAQQNRAAHKTRAMSLSYHMLAARATGHGKFLPRTHRHVGLEIG